MTGPIPGRSGRVLGRGLPTPNKPPGSKNQVNPGVHLETAAPLPVPFAPGGTQRNRPRILPAARCPLPAGAVGLAGRVLLAGEGAREAALRRPEMLDLYFRN